MERLETEYGSGRWKGLRGSLSDLHMARSVDSVRQPSARAPSSAAAAAPFPAPSADMAASGNVGATAATAATAGSTASAAALDRVGDTSDSSAVSAAAGAGLPCSDASAVGLGLEVDACGGRAASAAVGAAEGAAPNPRSPEDDLSAASSWPLSQYPRTSAPRVLALLPETHPLQLDPRGAAAHEGDPGCDPSNIPSRDPTSSPSTASLAGNAGASRLRGGCGVGQPSRSPAGSQYPVSGLKVKDKAGAASTRATATEGAWLEAAAGSTQARPLTRPRQVLTQAGLACVDTASALVPTPFTVAAQTPFSPPETQLSPALGCRPACPPGGQGDNKHLVLPGGPAPAAAADAPDARTYSFEGVGGSGTSGGSEDRWSEQAEGSRGGTVSGPSSSGSSTGGTVGSSVGQNPTPPDGALSLANDPRIGLTASFETFEAAINAAIAAVSAERRRPQSAPPGGLGSWPQAAPALDCAAGERAAPLRLPMPKLRVRVHSPRTAGLLDSGSSDSSVPQAAVPAMGAIAADAASSETLPSVTLPCRSAPLHGAGSAPYSPLPPLPVRARPPPESKNPKPSRNPGPNAVKRVWLPDTPLATPSKAEGPCGPYMGPYGSLSGGSNNAAPQQWPALVARPDASAWGASPFARAALEGAFADEQPPAAARPPAHNSLWCARAPHCCVCSSHILQGCVRFTPSVCFVCFQVCM